MTQVLLQRNQLFPQLCLKRKVISSLTSHICWFKDLKLFLRIYLSKFEAVYLQILGSLLQRTHLVSLVLLGGVTHAAHHLKVIHAEELDNFPVCNTPLLRRPGLLPRPARPGPRPRRGRPPLLLPQEGVGHVLEGQADGGLGQRALPPADGALAPGLFLVPELVQAGPAEAVAALEHDGLPEDLAADGAGQLILQQGARARGDGPRAQGRGGLGDVEEGQLARLRGRSGPQGHDQFLQWGAALVLQLVFAHQAPTESRE